MGHYFSNDGYKLNLTFKGAYATLNNVSLGRRKSVKWKKLQFVIDLVLMEQGANKGLEVVHYDTVDDITDEFYDAVHYDMSYQVTDECPCIYQGSAN